MSNERFDRIEQMIEQLIKITANTNAAVSELKQEVKVIDQRMGKLDQHMGKLDQHMGKLDQRMGKLDQRMDKLESTMATKEDMTALEARMEKGFTDVVNMINVIGDRTEGISRRIETKLDVLNERIFEHEADIRLLKKVK